MAAGRGGECPLARVGGRRRLAAASRCGLRVGLLLAAGPQFAAVFGLAACACGVPRPRAFCSLRRPPSCSAQILRLVARPARSAVRARLGLRCRARAASAVALRAPDLGSPGCGVGQLGCGDPLERCGHSPAPWGTAERSSGARGRIDRRSGAASRASRRMRDRRWSAASVRPSLDAAAGEIGALGGRRSLRSRQRGFEPAICSSPSWAAASGAHQVVLQPLRPRCEVGFACGCSRVWRRPCSSRDALSPRPRSPASWARAAGTSAEPGSHRQAAANRRSGRRRGAPRGVGRRDQRMAGHLRRLRQAHQSSKVGAISASLPSSSAAHVRRAVDQHERHQIERVGGVRRRRSPGRASSRSCRGRR